MNSAQILLSLWPCLFEPIVLCCFSAILRAQLWLIFEKLLWKLEVKYTEIKIAAGIFNNFLLLSELYHLYNLILM